MKKYHHLSLIAALASSPIALADTNDDVWTYQNNNGVTLEQACHNRTTCERIYSNAYYSAFVNNRSETGCNIGDLLIVQHKSRIFKKMATGTCSPSASIEVSTYGGKKNIDVVIGDRLIERYPLDTWTIKDMNKEGKYTPMQQAMMDHEKSANTPLPAEEPKGPPAEWHSSHHQFELFQGVNVLTIVCSRQFEGSDKLSSSRLMHQNGLGRKLVDEVDVNGKRLSAKISNQEEWTQLVNALLSASHITAYIGNAPVAIWAAQPIQPNKPCNYYQG